jgi:hypothetical protein
MRQLIFGALLTLALSGTAQTTSRETAATKYDCGANLYFRYEESQGTSAARSKLLTQAAGCLEESYKLQPHAQTAYLLSIVYAHLRKKEKAAEYAQSALDGKPKLEPQFLEGARKILSWAKTVKEPNGTVIAVGADTPPVVTVPKNSIDASADQKPPP